MNHTFALLLSFVALGSFIRSGVAAADRPNILYVYVDDMGWGSIGPNGQAARKATNQASVKTPNLDELARQGVNFTRGYGCHVCSPARSSQQSGFHQGHTFADRNDPNNAKKAMRANDVLIGDVLSSAGYTTGYWGKWGYGGSKDQNNPVIENVQTLPTSHGYQHVLAELHHVRAHTFFQPTLWRESNAVDAVGRMQLVPNSMSRYIGDPSYPDTPALQNHAGYPSTAYCDDSYAFAALHFIREQGNRYNESGQPFFGLLAVQIPHAPFGEISSLPDWDKAYTDDKHFAGLAEQTRQWAAMVTRIDTHVGNLLDALEDPNQDGDRSDSIAENTLVVFQSDNGGPGGKSLIELDTNGGLRGTKGSIYEGGIRVPLVMRWPAKIHANSILKAGTSVDRVVDVTDMMPTFCDLANAPIPLAVDGVSIAPTLTGTGHQRQRDFIIHEADNGQSIIRENLKLVRESKSRRKTVQLALYDLAADPAESNDISKDHPEIVKELEALLLGERVTEPPGFANTYHHWTGKSDAKTSAPDNWSDYVYANDGVTYQTDTGAPQVSWIATIENTSQQSNSASADSDLAFLGLEVKGNLQANATQSLVLAPGVNLTGRNEIRISPAGAIVVDGGTISTQRQMELQPGGTLSGNGSIQGDVFNSGTVLATESGFSVDGHYRQRAVGTLRIAIDSNVQEALTIDGTAKLDGTLAVNVPDGIAGTAGDKLTIVSAGAIDGKFSNPGGEVVTDGGTRYAIGYTDTSVTLTQK